MVVTDHAGGARSPSPTGSATPRQGAAGGCAVGDLFRLMGRHHVLDILYIFIEEVPGPRRFVDLQKRLGISPNTLSERLKDLVEAGLLSRTAYNEIPPRVDYEATAKANELRPVFASLVEWAARHDLKRASASAAATASS